MKFVGTIRPPFPINDFTTSIYLDEKNFSEEVFFTHEVQDGLISSFELIKIDKEHDFISSDKPRMVAIKDKPFFCYVDERNVLTDGTYDELSISLIHHLDDKDLNVNAKIIICSFLRLHGRTARLIKISEKEFKEAGLNVHLNVRDFADADRLPIENEDHISSAFRRCNELIFKYRSITWEDLFLIIDLTAFIGPYKVSLENLLASSSRKTKKTICDTISKDIKAKLYSEVKPLLRINNFFNAVMNSDIELHFPMSSSIIENEIEQVLKNEPLNKDQSFINVKLSNLKKQSQKIIAEERQQKEIILEYGD